MDIVYTYSHLGGEQILKVDYPELYKEILNVVKGVRNPGRNKISKEKNMMGKKLYAPIELNKLFREEFEKVKWHELKDKYNIEIPGYPIIIKGAFKQCDFYKDPILLEVQLGKYAFMFYDLAKFQYFYNQGKIKVGVEIVPCHFLQKQMSSGVSFGEQLIYDLGRLSKNFPSVPVMIVLVDMPIDSDDYYKEDRIKIREARKGVKEKPTITSADEEAD
ncbi:restriction endonuclease [Candidatus Marsarchaeota archaeon]|nr:restriction endonuclease [Candidatus Marsarchaeota archaeon]